MNQNEQEELRSEFRAAFCMAVRHDEESSQATDSRTQMLGNLLKLSFDELVEFMPVSDLAVHLSKCVGIADRRRAKELAKLDNQRVLSDKLCALKRDESLPLAVDADSPLAPRVRELLTWLLASAGRRSFYQQLVFLLDSALDEEGVRVWLFYPHGRPDFCSPAKPSANAGPTPDLVDLMNSPAQADEADQEEMTHE